MAEIGTAIGLDIDQKSIKFVKIKQTNGDVTLLKYAVRDIPQTENNIKAASDILKELFKEERSDTPVYTCAFGMNVSLKRITIPEMPANEIAEAIRWEAKNLVPFALENAVIEYYKIGEVTDKSLKKIDIMFAVAGAELMNFLNSVSKEAGVKFAGITLIPLALGGLLFHGKNPEKAKVSAVIDIGAEAASINLFKGDMLNFTREITVAGDSLTKAMSGLLVADRWQLNLTYEQAEAVKIKYGIPKKDTTELTEDGIPLIHIYEMMAPTLRRLQNEILRSFDYYKEEFREEKIDGIYLTGGGSSLKNLDEFLSSALSIKVEKIDLNQMLKIDPSAKIDQAKLQEMSSRLSLATGLALEKARTMNLQKGKEKPKSVQFDIEALFKLLKLPKIPVQVPVNLSLFVAAAVLIAGVSYNIYLSGQRDQLKKELASKQQVLAAARDVSDRRMILDQISKEQTHIRETLSQVTGVLPMGILLTQIQYDNSKKQIWLSGESDGTKTVGRLLKNLQDSPAFTNSTLIEARKGVVEGVEKIIFKVTFNLT